MALKTKTLPAAVQEAPPEAANQPRNNPEVDARLNVFIDANRRDFDYYTKLVAENPDRAVRSLMLKDMVKHESDMKLIFKQLPAAQEIFKAQPVEVQERINARLAEVNPFYQEKAFVNEVLREMNRQDYSRNRQSLLPAKQGAGMAVG
jgi:hypothetical protein